jgi:hypothetical protein
MDKDKIIELDSVKTCKEKQYVRQLISEEFSDFNERFLDNCAEKFTYDRDDFMLAVFSYAFTRGFIKGKEIQ